MTEYEIVWYRENMWRGGVTWRYKFCWFPNRCALTGKQLWLHMAYCGYRMLNAQGEPIVEYRWHDPGEHLIWVLKGN